MGSRSNDSAGPSTPYSVATGTPETSASASSSKTESSSSSPSESKQRSNPNPPESEIDPNKDDDISEFVDSAIEEFADAEELEDLESDSGEGCNCSPTNSRTPSEIVVHLTESHGIKVRDFAPRPVRKDGPRSLEDVYKEYLDNSWKRTIDARAAQAQEQKGRNGKKEKDKEKNGFDWKEGWRKISASLSTLTSGA